MNKCPCCSNTLLKHWEQRKTYWYCGTCRQEMPNLELTDLVNRYQQQGIAIFNQLSSTKSLVSSLKQKTANSISS